ncbi:MAG: Ribosomal protein S8E [Candidatus Methanohalarchaeum thermophilum]|uniref:Small ribosomal subunit protein eS8 n=1 Tax=Methanohalarchaeum thermophilum TaxID=1903181 RepID=A0A1Q6DXA6_METT1|nr:MAG: Ribosomal protein S8E [Candidatus Methanohalarchaeum thermophilum]
MAKYHGKSKRTKTGGRRKPKRKKRKSELGREFLEPKIGEETKKKLRTMGGNGKTRLLRTNKVNLTDPDSGETEKIDIENVVENEANPHYVRRNIITKGAIIETEKGKAKVKNRPGQEGTVNAVLINE